MSRPWQIAPDNRDTYVAPSKSDFYSSNTWRKARSIHIRKHPFCVVGRRVGLYNEVEQVDHIIPLSHGGSTLNSLNLQSLTSRRHSLKTQYEIRAKGSLYEHADGLPVLEWGKLKPVGKHPVVVIIGPSGAGKSTLIEAMSARRHFDHVHHIDQSNWTDISQSLWNDGGHHLLECTGAHFLFRKMLLDFRLSFFIVRISIPYALMIKRRGDKYGSAELNNSYDNQLIINEDVQLYGNKDIESNVKHIINKLNLNNG